MTIFFDTNILLDVALRREPHFTRSRAVLGDAIEHHACFMSWHTVSNLSYILSKLEGRDLARMFIENIAKVVRVAAVTHDDLYAAFGYDSGDFEDAMQIACALACGAELIVSRDPAGFSRSPVPLADGLGAD